MVTSWLILSLLRGKTNHAALDSKRFTIYEEEKGLVSQGQGGDSCGTYLPTDSTKTLLYQPTNCLLSCLFILQTKKHPINGMLFKCLATSYSHRGKPPTTIGAKELNVRVRHGNGCDLFAIATKLITSDDRQISSSASLFLSSRMLDTLRVGPTLLPRTL